MSLLPAWSGHSNVCLHLFFLFHLWAMVSDYIFNNLYSVLLVIYFPSHIRDRASLSELAGCCSRLYTCMPANSCDNKNGREPSLILSYGLCVGSGQVESILPYAKSSLFHDSKCNMIPWSGVSYKRITVSCSYFDTCSVLRLHFYSLSALPLWIPGWLFYCLLSYSHPSQFSDALFVCLHTPKGFCVLKLDWSDQRVKFSKITERMFWVV